MTEEKFENLAEIFKALAHPLRVKIALGLMKKEECNVSKIVERTGVAQPTVSQHLNILKNAGVIKGNRKGNSICYQVENETVIKILSEYSEA